MASDSEEDVDAICGWGAADFDDELPSRGRQKAAVKVTTKRRPEKSVANSKSVSGLNNSKQQQSLGGARSSSKEQTGSIARAPIKQVQMSTASKERMLTRKQQQKETRSYDLPSPKPSPRTISLGEENAFIAAFGRQRRMKIVAAAMASNVSRKSSLGSVVSASFDADSDGDDEEVEAPRRRRPDEWVPSSAPDNQAKLPRVMEPSTAPAGPGEAHKLIHPPLPLPLLSIKPDCGGNETRLLGKGAPMSEAPRHWRRRRRQQSSILPTKDVSDHWDSNFPPALRHSRSPRKYYTELPSASSSSVSSFTRAVQVPLAPRQGYQTALRGKESLPSIHQNSKRSDLVTDVLANAVKCSGPVAASSDDQVTQKHEKEGDEDDDSWTHCYDDPEVLANSMAGLIQALSAFAAGGKHAKASKGGKSKRRRTKFQQQQQLPPTPPLLRLLPPREINVTSIRAPMTEGQQKAEPSARRRKHRKLRNKQPKEADVKDQAP